MLLERTGKAKCREFTCSCDIAHQPASNEGDVYERYNFLWKGFHAFVRATDNLTE
jgi:hypothetical protein